MADAVPLKLSRPSKTILPRLVVGLGVPEMSVEPVN
jgi:hypothetical protein